MSDILHFPFTLYAM